MDGRSLAKSGWHSDRLAFITRRFSSSGRHERQARSIWFKELEMQIKGGRKHRRCGDDDEEQDLTQAPTMEWNMGDNMDNSQNYAV